ncbi:hypothetical protein B0H14DRAFT_2593595 [Mycena olivaceomarginata]|nr:hypothetical protein B0H14DRAFT_2640294 [Mycena olivaceomarginata]KAJ7830108.1 hypothetical protein B0H14DRAFT_2593595 [Mycena olivaceomarginata]
MNPMIFWKWGPIQPVRFPQMLFIINTMIRASVRRSGSLAWLASTLSAVLTARLILNMREVADTDGMAVGDVASEDADTVEWNDIDGTPMEHIRGHNSTFIFDALAPQLLR